MSEKSENKIIDPVVLDSKFTFLMFYFYLNRDERKNKNNFKELLKNKVFYSTDSFLDIYERCTKTWIIQSFLKSEEISIDDLRGMSSNSDINWVFYDIEYKFNEIKFKDYFDWYYNFLESDKLKIPNYIFTSWKYYQNIDDIRKMRLRNFPKFSIQIKKIAKILENYIQEFWLESEIIVSMQNQEFHNLNIIDLICFFSYKWFIDIKDIFFNDDINFSIKIEERWIDLIDKNNKANDVWVNNNNLEQFWKDLYYLKERNTIIYEWKHFNLRESLYEKFLKILLINIWIKCWHKEFRDEFKNVEPIELLDYINDKYNYIKKKNNKYYFLHKYIIPYKGEWYEIKKYYP